MTDGETDPKTTRARVETQAPVITCLTTALYVPRVVHVVPIYYQARYPGGERAGEFMSRGVLLWVASRGRGKSREQASWR